MSVIHYQKKEDMKFETAGNGILRAEMLPGMVDGVHTYKCKVAAGTVVTLETFGDQTQIYYFTRGEGYVATPKKAFNIEEPSLFIPNMDKEANILHAATDMEFLQLTSVMLPEDYEQFEHWHIALPRFCPLSGCIEYIEGFRQRLGSECIVKHLLNLLNKNIRHTLQIFRRAFKLVVPSGDAEEHVAVDLVADAARGGS